MLVSPAGQDFIKSWESFRSMPYRDSAGKLTIGYGHLLVSGDTDFSDGIDKGMAEDIFLYDLSRKAEEPLLSMVSKEVTLSQRQIDALASLCFNIGAGHLAGSTLIRMLNHNFDEVSIGQQFLRWDFANGAPSEGLALRRSAERDIYISGKYVNHS